MNNQFCYHSFNPEEHNGKTWMVCAKCGLRNPLGLFQHWDTDRDGPAVRFNRNSYAYQYEPEIMPKKSAIDYLIEAFKAPFNQKPKRNPYMTIRRLSSYGGNFGTHRVWCVHCTKCEIPGTKKPLIFAKTSTWQEAITTATRHARNHHRSQPCLAKIQASTPQIFTTPYTTNSNTTKTPAAETRLRQS